MPPISECIRRGELVRELRKCIERVVLRPVLLLDAPLVDGGVFGTFLDTRSDNNFVPKGASVSEGGHSPAAQRLAVVDEAERVSGKCRR